jgi:m7GpppX diphosphatase
VLTQHIRKYQRQVYRMVRETPAIYQQVVLPYIEQLPTSRIQWVYNILDGISEQEDVLLSDSDPKNGFVILPDRQVI